MAEGWCNAGGGSGGASSAVGGGAAGRLVLWTHAYGLLVPRRLPAA